MITMRPAAERGHVQLGWLDTWHTFSFGEYYDPAHMGFRPLRVLNEDYVQPGQGFGMHPHRDMEIITYLLAGQLQHKDSMGNGSVIRPGEVQRMSAGSGILHSEFNPSTTELVHLLQIWLLPEQKGIVPSYEQKAFSTAERQGALRLIAARDGRDGAVTIHQDAALYATLLDPGAEVGHDLAPGRHAWVQVARGRALVNGLPMAPGDGAAVSDERRLVIAGGEGPERTELLLFDLP